MEPDEVRLLRSSSRACLTGAVFAVSPSTFSHKFSSLRGVDALAVGYLAGASVPLAAGCATSWVYPLCIALHVLGGTGIVALARARSLPPSLRVVRALYPLGLLLVLYGEVDLLVQLLHEPPGFDALVRRWDRGLFGVHLHHHLFRWLSGTAWREFFHLLYLTYYGLLVGAFVGVWWCRPRTLPRFAFVVTGMFVSFIALFVAVPVAGPLATPGVSLMTDGVFPSVVAWVYTPLTVNGIHTGAFPSSHVGMSVGVVLGLAPRRWWARLGLWGLVLGIAVSTVYGRFHYAIDAVAGVLAGGLLFVVWSRLYTAFTSRRAVAVERTDAPRRLHPAPPMVLPDEGSG